MKNISVCIATHDGGKYISEQLDSILCQLGSNDEVIISDDGSTDDTIAQIQSYGDSRIHLYKIEHVRSNHKAHYYITKNFENAIRQAEGQYIFLADQDDVWMPNKVKCCVEKLEKCDLVLSNLECVDAQLNPIGRTIYSDKFRFHNFLLLSGKYYGCGMAFKREVLRYVLPFPDKLLLHDFWIGIMAEICGKVEYLNIPLVKYRMHNSNASMSHSNNSLFYKLNYRVYIMWNLIKRTIHYYFHNHSK